MEASKAAVGAKGLAFALALAAFVALVAAELALAFSFEAFPERTELTLAFSAFSFATALEAPISFSTVVGHAGDRAVIGAMPAGTALIAANAKD